MDDLIARFANVVRVSHAPSASTIPQLTLLTTHDGVGVFSTAPIAAHTTLGEIVGYPMYIWDMDHSDYVIVGEEFVLDVSNLNPRPILCNVREDNSSPNRSNCCIHTMVNEETGDARFFLVSFRDIDTSEEIVYSLNDFPVYDT